MANRKQISFWINLDSKSHQELLTMLEYYKAKGINISDIIRRAVRIVYFIDTRNTNALLNELPASLGLGVGTQVQNASMTTNAPYIPIQEGGIEIGEINTDGLAEDASNQFTNLFD